MIDQYNATLRPHQKEVLRALESMVTQDGEWFLSIPTGCGCSVIISEFLSRHPGAAYVSGIRTMRDQIKRIGSGAKNVVGPLDDLDRFELLITEVDLLSKNLKHPRIVRLQ